VINEIEDNVNISKLKEDVGKIDDFPASRTNYT
jgi:hypothetical protein